jgi:hypothetical protein
LVLTLVAACGGTDDPEAASACQTGGCDAGAGGSASPHADLLDCPELCRDVATCSGWVDPSCGAQCENTLNMAVSLGCGPDYAGYVNCVREVADACVREQPPECAGVYADLDTCLCGAVPEDCR